MVSRPPAYGCHNAEMDLDLRCLAVPVCDGEQRVIAAISIATRKARVSAADLMVHIETLRAAANVVARRLRLD